MDAANQTLPFLSNIELWLLTLVSQMCSSPQYAEGCSAVRPAAWPGPRLNGIFGSLTGARKVVAMFFTGSSIGKMSELYSGDPMSGPYALTVGFRLSVEVRACRQCLSSIESLKVIPMLRSTP